jgi:hypothetical protein
MNKNILRFPVLLEISIRHNNTFWSEVFKKLAYGKAPYGCYITSSSFLVSTNKGHEFTYFIGDQDKSPETIGNELIDILKKKMNFMSISDRLRKLDVFRSTKRKLKDKLWSSKWVDIRRKKLKDQIIEMYVLKLQKTSSLQLCTVKFLLAAIIIGLIFKTIEPDSIVMKNGTITSIPSLKLVDGRWSFEKVERSEKVKVNNILVKPKKTLHDIWLKAS